MSQARPQAAALLRNVDPSTEKGRAELSSVTVGGGPPRSPAEAQTPTLAAAADVSAVLVLVAFCFFFLVCFGFLVFFVAFAAFVATTAVVVVDEDVVFASFTDSVVPVEPPATLHHQ